jgi:hypothetical protein
MQVAEASARSGRISWEIERILFKVEPPKGGQFGRENAPAHKSMSTARATWRFLTKT